MRSEIISDSEMSFDVVCAKRAERMNLMRAYFLPLSEITPSPYSEFTHTFVARFLEFGIFAVQRDQIRNNRQNIDYRLCFETFYGCAADVVDFNKVFPQHRPYFFRLSRVHFSPLRSVIHYFDFHFKAPLRIKINSNFPPQPSLRIFLFPSRG